MTNLIKMNSPGGNHSCPRDPKIRRTRTHSANTSQRDMQSHRTFVFDSQSYLRDVAFVAYSQFRSNLLFDAERKAKWSNAPCKINNAPEHKR